MLMKRLSTLFVIAIVALTSFAQKPGDKVDILGRFSYCWNGNESMTNENGVITFNSVQWGGVAAWIGGEDWSGFSKVVFEFAEPTPFYTQINLMRNEGQDGYTQGCGEGSTSVEMSFDDKDVSYVSQIALQASGEATIVIKAIYLVVADKPVDYSEYTELINNGNCEGDDVSNYVSKEYVTGSQSWGPSRIVTDPTDASNKCIEVVSEDIPEGKETIDDWDSQFFITVAEKLEPGDKYRITFRVRAEKEASAQTQSHNQPGGYIHWAFLGDIPFTTEWADIEKTGTISEEQVYGQDPNYSNELHTIAFNLAVLKEANKYYFDDISVLILKPKQENYEDYTDLITNGNCEGDETTNYVSKEYITDEEYWGASRLVVDPTDATNKCVVVTSRDIPEGKETIDDWDSQFFITVADKLQPGDEYMITFRVRADKAATAQTQAHNHPGEYNFYDMLGNISFSDQWVTIKKTGTITENQVYRPQDDPNYSKSNEMHTIAFNLAVLKEANNYYFDDIVFKVKKAPVTKLIGDANGDGVVNITDVSVAVEYVLSGATDFIVMENADVNEDGYVNITDVSLIVDILLGQ